MARKKTSVIPAAYARPISVRISSALELEIKEICKAHDLSTSHFCRRAIKTFLQSIRGKDHLYQEIGV